MVPKKIQYLFVLTTVLALFFLWNNSHKRKSFLQSPLPQEYQKALLKEEQRVLTNMQKNFGFSYKVPMVVTTEIPGQIYGITAMDDSGAIKIYLNKKVMQESFEYMIDNVIAHEYAHALLFKNGAYQRGEDGHSPRWQRTCVQLGGAKCEQYVNTHDVVMGKLPF